MNLTIDSILKLRKELDSFQDPRCCVLALSKEAWTSVMDILSSATHRESTGPDSIFGIPICEMPDQKEPAYVISNPVIAEAYSKGMMDESALRCIMRSQTPSMSLTMTS